MRVNRAPVTIAFVGAGHMGRRHAAAARQLEEAGRCRIVGVADTSPERARSLAGELRALAFHDCVALLQGASPELVVVATPPVRHVQDIVDCLEHGAHVLCEKPYAISAAEGAVIAAAHRKAGSLLAPMASKYRYDRAVRWARDLVDMGAIGSLLSLQVRFAQQVDMSSRWHARPEVSGGGVLMDNGPHAFDLAHLFLGPLASISARRGEIAGVLPVEDSVHLSAQGVRGGALQAFLSWSDASADPCFLRLSGTTGTVKVGWKDSCLVPHGNADPVALEEGFDGPRAIRTQLEDLVRAIETGASAQATFEDAIGNVSAIAAAYRALEAEHVPVEGRLSEMRAGG